MPLKESVAGYLQFSRKERIAVLTLIVLIITIFLLPRAAPLTQKKKEILHDTAWIAEVKKLDQTEAVSNKNTNATQSGAYQFDKTVNPSAEYQVPLSFYFDPNKTSYDDWKKLGIRDKTISTLLHYIEKGGRFKTASDLQRIYGFPESDFQRLAPYVRIDTSRVNLTKKYPEKSGYSGYALNRPVYQVIDINTADTSAYISLPGIGSRLAARIINFRDKLGGFYSVEQIGETYGVPDSTFQKIKQYLKLENNSLKKININTATVDELKAHPYIRYQLANPIIAYRNQHGAFQRIADLKQILVISDEAYRKMAPYLSIE